MLDRHIINNELPRNSSTYKPRITRAGRLQANFIALAYRTLNGVLLLCAYVLWPTRRPQKVQRILIYRIGNIGDITCALPAMQAVRRTFSNAQLTLLTSPGPAALPSAKDLLKEVDWIDRIITYYPTDIADRKGRWALLKDLRQRRFDIWINLSASAPNLNLLRELRDMLFARLVGPRWARGWMIDTITWGAQAQSAYLNFPGEVDRLLMIVGRAGINPQPVCFGLAPIPAAINTLDQVLKDHGHRGWVAIAPGCKRSTNRWPDDRFTEVARYLTSKGFAVLVLGGPGDTVLGERIICAAGTSSVNLAGKLTLTETIEALRRCRLAVCVDSGIQHLASAVGTPALSLFSFWQMRGKWRPYGDKNVVIQKWVSCHTCLLNECPYENRCMSDIKVADVLVNIARQLPN
jgi:ADP-heptose:LPS heptosyltransferase